MTSDRPSEPRMGSNTSLSAKRRPLKHGHGQAARAPVLRLKAVMWAVVLLLATIAGLAGLIWNGLAPGVTGAAHTPVPQVTVTVEPGASAPDAAGGGAGHGATVPQAASTEDRVAGATAPITAQPIPEGASGTQDHELAVIVGPGIDLSQHSIDKPESPWVVVNKARPLDPQLWEPADLEAVDGALLVPQAAAALEELMDDAGAADLQIQASSGYRGYGMQQAIYDEYAADYGQERADRFSARAGFSEHQTGWAVDVYSSQKCRLKECFSDEPAGQWVADHAAEYGFVVRYPQGAKDVTGYTYEPWHLRFVGTELALAMREHGLATLEQAFRLPAAPTYD